MPDLDVRDKYTDEIIGRVSIASPDDVAAATRAARDAFPAWAATPSHRRAAVLAHTSELLRERREESADDLRVVPTPLR